MAGVKKSIGQRIPVMLEQWTQGKLQNNSNTDTLQGSFNVWAEVERKTGTRTMEGFQLHENETYTMIFRKNNLAIDTLWKVVYKGRRMTIKTIEELNEKDFYYRLTVEVK